MPLKGNFRLDRALSNLSVRYSNAEYIADKAVPDMMVDKESGQYWIYDNNYRNEPTIRANGSPSKQIEFEASTSTYHVNLHSLKAIITARDKNNTDDVFQLERDNVEDLTDKIQIELEREVHNLLFTTTSFANNESLDTNSSFKYNTTTSNPVQKILSVTSYIKRYAGAIANVMITDQDGRDSLKENLNIIDRIKYTQRGILTDQLMASMFDLDKIYVGSAMYNTLDEGQTMSLTNIWGNHALIAYMDTTPRLKTKSAAGILRLRGGGLPWQVKRWKDQSLDPKDADVIEVNTWFKPKVFASTSGYLLKSVTSS